MRRTFPRLAMFASDDGIAALWRVLRAYALHDPVVGYCQGMNFVAGLLLLHLDEPSAFAGESLRPSSNMDPMWLVCEHVNEFKRTGKGFLSSSFSNSPHSLFVPRVLGACSRAEIPSV